MEESMSRETMKEMHTKGGGIRPGIVLTGSVVVLLFSLAAAGPAVALSGRNALSVLVNQVGDPRGPRGPLESIRGTPVRTLLPVRSR
jgi:hypothetical protein